MDDQAESSSPSYCAPLNQPSQLSMKRKCPTDSAVDHHDPKQENSGGRATTDSTNNKNQNTTPRGRSSPVRDAYKEAYRGYSFEPIPSSGRPGTPHRFFQESYRVFYNNHLLDDDKREGQQQQYDVVDDAESDKETSTSLLLESPLQPSASDAPYKTPGKVVLPIVIHKNANGLAVVCVSETVAGDGCGLSEQSSYRRKQLSRVEFKVQAPYDPDGSNNNNNNSMSTKESNGAKRKRQAKMLKGKQNVANAIHPGYVVAVLHYGGNDQLLGGEETQQSQRDYVLPVPCGVWGSVLEINTKLTIETLQCDPLLNGYLAIVLPTGPFPPPSLQQQSPSDVCIPK